MKTKQWKVFIDYEKEEEWLNKKNQGIGHDRI